MILLHWSIPMGYRVFGFQLSANRKTVIVGVVIEFLTLFRWHFKTSYKSQTKMENPN